MLIDSNIGFSLLLEQNKFKETEELFDIIEHLSLKVQILDFALYSMILKFISRGHDQEIKEFLKTLNSSKTISIYRSKPSEISEALNLNLDLDFDDKIHYYIAKNKNFTFVSYDQDFDKTDLKRFTPAQILDLLNI